MKKIIKIGTNRGKARLWLEGKCLEQMGWVKGRAFYCMYNEGAVHYESAYHNNPLQFYNRKVAGTDKRPVIDTNSDKIKDAIGDFTHVEVTITEDDIVMKGVKSPNGLISKVTKGVALVTALTVPFISQFKPNAMKVLVGCEESGRVRNAFVEAGHDAISCDLMDTSDPTGWHMQDDLLNHLDGDWDMLLAFPPCTYLTNTAAWAFKDPDYDRYPEYGYHQRVKADTLTGEARREAREEALEFVRSLYHSKIPKVCIENPVGSLSKMFRKPDQTIQPWQFGDPESKTTCLWLKGLDPLVATEVLDIESHGYLAKNGVYRWMNQTAGGQSNLPPTPDRDIIRSKTYQGIANAMAQQWGGVLC